MKRALFFGVAGLLALAALPAHAAEPPAVCPATAPPASPALPVPAAAAASNVLPQASSLPPRPVPLLSNIYCCYPTDFIYCEYEPEEVCLDTGGWFTTTLSACEKRCPMS